ncbi:hypothetical protein [Nocardiopsis sp. LOL_012]|uniref:hypothetical protein n=1 Tax=Nocardiopsis sp. LOL_012 TaxID=3345409 RepID=UPI003A85E006
MAWEPFIARLPGTSADVLIDGGDTAVVRTSAGRFLRLQSPPPGLPDALSGGSNADEDAVAYADRLQAVMAAREDDEASHRWPEARRAVALVGAGPIVDAVAEALSEWRVSVSRYDDVAALIAAVDGAEAGVADGESTPPWHLVIAYADSPAERGGWDRIDRLPRRGTAWLRAYREGENCFVDPICLTPDDPGSDQVLRRRLAASPTPRETDAWRRAAAPDAPPSPAARTLLVGRLLTVALTWAREDTALEGYRTTLWKLVPASGAVSEHTVLAYDPPPPLDRAARRRA